MECGYTNRLNNDVIENNDRNTPKNPINTKMKFGCIGLKCPICSSLVNFYQNYCSLCGQKLNWDMEK